jgi:hypothetical protein
MEIEKYINNNNNKIIAQGSRGGEEGYTSSGLFYCKNILPLMSISSINGDSHRNCHVWKSKVGEFFPVEIGMEEKIPPKEV